MARSFSFMTRQVTRYLKPIKRKSNFWQLIILKIESWQLSYLQYISHGPLIQKFYGREKRSFPSHTIADMTRDFSPRIRSLTPISPTKVSYAFRRPWLFLQEIYLRLLPKVTNHWPRRIRESPYAPLSLWLSEITLQYLTAARFAHDFNDFEEGSCLHRRL